MIRSAKNAGFAAQPALLLVTLGSKTGRLREVALPYFQLDGKLMIVGSRGGLPEDPFWVKNLRRNPEASIYVRRKKRRCGHASPKATSGRPCGPNWRP